MKSRDGKSQRKEGKKKEDQKRESLTRKKVQVRKGRKVAKHCFFHDLWLRTNTTCSVHFWTFRCRFAWQAQGIVHLVKSEQNVRVL